MNTGAFGENFPYTNFHDLNLDWILKIVKDFELHYTSIHETIEAGKTEINELSAQKLTELIQSMNDEYTRLAGLLTSEYNQYIDDIDTQARRKLVELTQQMENKLTETLILLDEHLAEVESSIPLDYSELSNTVSAIQNSLGLFVEGNIDLSAYLDRENYVYDITNGVYEAVSGYNCYKIPLTNSLDFFYIMTTNNTPFWQGLAARYTFGIHTSDPSDYLLYGVSGNNWLGGSMTNSSYKHYGDAIAFGKDDRTEYVILGVAQSQLPYIRAYKNNKYYPNKYYVNKIETYTNIDSSIAFETAMYKDGASGYLTDLGLSPGSSANVTIIKLNEGDIINQNRLAETFNFYGEYSTDANNSTRITTMPFSAPSDCIVFLFTDASTIVTLDPTTGIKIPERNVVGTLATKPLAGKDITFFGDSIVYRYTWEPEVIEKVGGTGHNCGIGSTCLAGSGASAFWQDVRLNAVKATNPDVVTILGGANDLVQNIPIGNDTDITNRNTNTFLGAYAYIINNLLTWKPSLKIIIMSTTWAHNDGTDYSNTYTYGDYANACKKIAQYYHLPYVDLYNESGFNKYTMNSSPYNIYSADHIHPNTAGSQIIASMVIEKIFEVFRN